MDRDAGPGLNACLVCEVGQVISLLFTSVSPYAKLMV